MDRPRRVGVEFNPHIIGGTEHFLHALFSYLDRTRFVPVAIASSSGRWQELLDGVAETHVVPYVTESGAPADIARALQGLGLDLVQSSYFAPTLAFAAAKAELPHVWRLGGHVDALERPWQTAEKLRFLALVCMLSRRVVCGSHFLRSQLVPVGADRAEVIPNGIDLRRFPALPIRDDQPVKAIAMVAHLMPQKRHEVFIRAVARIAPRLPETRFFIFGGSFATPELVAYEQSVRGLVDDLGLGSALEIHELCGDRLARLRNIDIVAMPGLNEGASNAIVEAMALGIPVVAADSGGNPELIEDGVSGRLLCACDPPALAGALLDLAHQPTDRRAMGEAARARVERERDIRTCARRYEELYTRVLNDGR